MALMLSAVLAVGSFTTAAPATAAIAGAGTTSASSIGGTAPAGAVAAIRPLAVPVKAALSGTVYGHTKTGTKPLAGVTVSAWSSTGYGNGVTDAAGKYKLTGLASGNYKISYTQYNTSASLSFVGQFWKNKATEAQANPVAVGTTNLSGYNVTLEQGSSISGKLTMLLNGVSRPATTLLRVTTYFNGSTTGVNHWAYIDAAGNYTISPLAAGSYKLKFGEVGATSGLRGEYYNNATTLAASKAISVGFAQSVTGINAELAGKPNVSLSAYVGGTTTVGSTLTAYAYAQPNTAATTYQWYRNGVAISGATKQNYVLVGGDLGKSMSVKATAAMTGYTSASTTASAWSIIQPGTLTGTKPLITGTNKVGSTLTVKTGAWSSGATLSYRWFRTGQPISGATAPTYKLATADGGTTVTVQVVATKLGYTMKSWTSAAVTIPKL
ncbi:hypothetical protein C3B59_05140 [Cryobacterium zongtaii]|uniref:Alpha-amylase n=1 Tax=Cryobacterium zongtaii TaxID=1259217 RepID=A0A2S3ZM28_9MICO|nr:hypothetical protein [Cryobacterium zongtaii]POH69731.1 hypothetical protein C3B59_05140 [Cryobacterium zongtaii]